MRQSGAVTTPRSRDLALPTHPPGALAGAALARAASLLHRNAAHHLANALLQLRLYERRIRTNPSRAGVLLQDTLESVQAALDAVRTAIHMLRSPDGSFPGIRRYLATTVEELRRPGRQFSLQIADAEALPYALEHALAIVGSEALTNAARHAAARRIAVKLRRRPGAVILDVVDNGRGFDYARARRRRDRGDGLALMEEQVAGIGGQLQISRRRSGGTQVRVIAGLNGYAP